jgi:hypothetical protein
MAFGEHSTEGPWPRMCVGGRHTPNPKASAHQHGWILPGTKRWCAVHQDWECRTHAVKHNKERMAQKVRA